MTLKMWEWSLYVLRKIYEERTSMSPTVIKEAFVLKRKLRKKIDLFPSNFPSSLVVIKVAKISHKVHCT